MQTSIAFLRAINVGGRSVKMERLRELFESIGFSNIQTYIQSGNVLFESSETDREILEQQIAAQLEKNLGYAVPTMIRTKTELLEIESFMPFSTKEIEEGAKLYVSFLQVPPDAADQQALLELGNEIDQFHIHKMQVYWLSRKQLGKSNYTNANIEKTLKMPATRRNMNTIRKIAKKYF